MGLEDFSAGRWGELSHICIPITTTDTNYELLAAIEGQRIKILRMMLSGDTLAIYNFFSGAEPLFSFYGAIHFGCDEQASDASIPAFITNVGDNFNLIVSTAVTANLYLQYQYGEV